MSNIKYYLKNVECAVCTTALQTTTLQFSDLTDGQGKTFTINFEDERLSVLVQLLTWNK